MIRAVPPEINGTVRIWIEWFGRSFAATACFVGWRWWIVLNMGLSRSESRRKIESEFGSGFSYRQLAFCRQFYRTYPMMNALHSQFNRYPYIVF